MSQKKETTILLISILITLAILGGLGFWLKNILSGDPNNSNQQNETVDQNRNKENTNIKNLVSDGNRLLITDNITPQKKAGIVAINNKNYREAVNQLESSLQLKANDPETLIYLNNARIANNKSYAIAVSVPIGNDIDGSQEILRGIAQVQNNLNNNGGINGIPIKIKIADDNNNPEIAKKLAKEFGKDSEILGVVGHWASDVTIATAPIYESQKLVAISPISTSVKLSSMGDYIYRTVPSDRFAGSALSRYQINQLKKKKTAIFYNPESNYSKSLKDEFTTTLFADGGEIVAEFDLNKSNFNAGKDVPEAIAKGAEVLMLATTTSTLDQTLQVIQVNDGKLPILAGDDAYSIKLLQVGGNDAEGVVVAIPWHILAHTNTNFVKESRQLWGADVSWRTVMAYDAIISLTEAMKINPTRQGIQETLSQSNFQAQGATSSVLF